MREDNGRFLQKAKSGKIELSATGLFIDDNAIILNVGGRFRPRPFGELKKVFELSQLQDEDDILPRLNKIGRLLDEGRRSEAVFFATMADWSLRSNSETSVATHASKANFNEAEPRDNRGWWTKDGQNDATAVIEDVKFNGYFHNVVVDDLLNAAIKKGSIAVNNVSVLGLSGMETIPDGLILEKGKAPYFIEVKTGEDPDFTKNQKQIYPLICLGGHTVSFDSQIRQVGLTPGQLLPPLDIRLITQSGPGQPRTTVSYCKQIGFWR